MQAGQRIFVSAENNACCGWQCKLFYVSALTPLAHQPTFIVHDSRLPWHQSFRELERAGASVCAAPSYAQSRADSYKPRNTAGSLIHAADMCPENEFIVLCDPDMIFVSNPELPNSLSVNLYSYMDYDAPEVLAAMKELNLPAKAQINRTPHCN